ncbi:MAG: hypothetical protein J6A92_02735 [Lachnospiraceae bacterium]|nr:hypothetical protein [Lachnospiraceae bacterium]
MNEFLDQYFPTDFISDYVSNNKDGLSRFRIYTLYRFFSSVSKTDDSFVHHLQEHFQAPLNEEPLEIALNYLSKDFFFSPGIRENSLDIFFLYYAIMAVEDAVIHVDFLSSIITTHCPLLSNLDFSDISTEITKDFEEETAFFGGLYLLSANYEALLSSYLPKFLSVYQEDFHFSCEDFVLYNFMDEYFEIKNCRNHPKYQELINTLILATLNAFDTTIEQCAFADALPQVVHPYSKFAGLYRFGALESASLESKEECITMMQHLFEYAVAYELRNNLFDFHIDEDRIITLDNWKDKLKWYNTQYTNAFNLAVSSFYAATLSRKMLKLQYKENLNKLR